MTHAHGTIGQIVAAMIGLTPAIAAPASAQWSEDAATNLAIADRTGEQTQAKIRATADGGAYVSWFDNSSGGYDVYLQRLDATGAEQWAHNGVLVADRAFGSTQDYGLAVDPAGNALLTFRDDRGTGTQITATLLDPTGAQPWGVTGVQLTDTTAFVAAPKIAATSDGFIVVAWTQDDTTRLQKLDVDGVTQWVHDSVIADGGGSSFSASDLHGSDGGSVIIALVRGFLSPTFHAQKISSTGAKLWGVTPLAIFDGGFLQVANFPKFVDDGAGGAVFGWYGTGPLQCYVQHVLDDGTEVFPHDGVAASTDGAQVRVSPAVAYRQASDEIFLFWTELNGTQSAWGLYGQKFDGTGARQWTDTGVVLIPLDGNERTQVRTLARGDGADVFVVERTGGSTQRILAARVDGAGDAAEAAVISAGVQTVSPRSPTGQSIRPRRTDPPPFGA